VCLEGVGRGGKKGGGGGGKEERGSDHVDMMRADCEGGICVCLCECWRAEAHN
jgi:hypothetical protein